jgi:hypothetical protein
MKRGRLTGSLFNSLFSLLLLCSESSGCFRITSSLTAWNQYPFFTVNEQTADCQLPNGSDRLDVNVLFLNLNMSSA